MVEFGFESLVPNQGRNIDRTRITAEMHPPSSPGVSRLVSR